MDKSVSRFTSQVFDDRRDRAMHGVILGRREVRALIDTSMHEMVGPETSGPLLD